MTNQTSGKPNVYALLIGVDCYLPNLLPDGGWYPSLGGCVRDIGYVEEFMRRRLGLKDEHILKLTATYPGPLPAPQHHDYKPTEPSEQWPTYQNMVAKFKAITELARSGDQVYVHYSGHGGRATTTYLDLKGEKGLDETLVPLDIGNSEARYLRDVELAHLLKTMVEKGLIVSVVLDSCHSGGATRGLGGAVARRAISGPGGGVPIDTTPRPTDSLVASPEELAATWGHITSGGTLANVESIWVAKAVKYLPIAVRYAAADWGYRG